MAKRANGEGNIRKRKDGKWLVTYPTGLYTDKGKREYVYRYCDTQAEAAEILRQLQAEKSMGVSQSKATVKTGEWMEKWIEGKAKGKKPLKPSTLASYRNNFRLHIPYRQRAFDKAGRKFYALNGTYPHRFPFLSQGSISAPHNQWLPDCR